MSVRTGSPPAPYLAVLAEFFQEHLPNAGSDVPPSGPTARILLGVTHTIALLE